MLKQQQIMFKIYKSKLYKIQIIMLRGIFGVYHYFYFWRENLMSHVTYDVEGTQDAILDPL